jgi:hypothetical protein
MKKRVIWNKISNYCIAIIGIMIVSKMFFRQYLGNVMDFIFLMAIIASVLFLVAEVMKYITRNEK